MRTNAGASRISSVSGLKASPQIAIVLSFNLLLNNFKSFSNKALFCISLTSSTARNTRMSDPFCSAVFIKALTSFGKQEPPYPIPG